MRSASSDGCWTRTSSSGSSTSSTTSSRATASPSSPHPLCRWRTSSAQVAAQPRHDLTAQRARNPSSHSPRLSRTPRRTAGSSDLAEAIFNVREELAAPLVLLPVRSVRSTSPHRRTKSHPGEYSSGILGGMKSFRPFYFLVPACRNPLR